jgi:hypothetical protein
VKLVGFGALPLGPFTTYAVFHGSKNDFAASTSQVATLMVFGPL